MDFEKPQQKEEEMGPFNEYKAETHEEMEIFLAKLEEFERNLPDDPEELIHMRNISQAGVKRMGLVPPKESEIESVCWDIAHAVNRKLNKIGYEEK